ncbi:MAG: hypothetical protein ABJG78_07535 [Cyclobacteriaceae bacterium]
MTIILCQSFLSIPLTITIAAKNENFLIISTNREAYKFFSQLYSEKEIVLLPEINVSLKGLLNINSILKAKRGVKRRIANYSKSDVYFFLVAFCEYPAWIVKVLSNKNKIYYKAATQLPNSVTKTDSIKGILHQTFSYYFWGINVDRKILDRTLFFPLSQKYFSKINSMLCPIVVDNEVIENVIKNKVRVGGKILYLSGGIIENNLVCETEFELKTNQFFDRIPLEEVFLKLHPRSNLARFAEKKIPQISSFIPANLICNNFDVVIGYNTATLYEAANGGKIAISLLNYFEPLSDNKRNGYIDYLRNNTKLDMKLYFPSSLEEVIQLIDFES